MASPKAGEHVVVVLDEELNLFDIVMGASRNDVRKILRERGLTDWQAVAGELVTVDEFKAVLDDLEEDDEDEDDPEDDDEPEG